MINTICRSRPPSPDVDPADAALTGALLGAVGGRIAIGSWNMRAYSANFK